MNKVKYRLINKSDNAVKTYTSARYLSIYLLGRRVDNFLIIKSVGDVDTLVQIKCGDVMQIQQRLEEV